MIKRHIDVPFDCVTIYWFALLISCHVNQLQLISLLIFLGLIDLADENGEIMFLQERAENYGNEFLKPRGIYILVRRESKFIESILECTWFSMVTTVVFKAKLEAECVRTRSHLRWGIKLLAAILFMTLTLKVELFLLVNLYHVYYVNLL